MATNHSTIICAICLQRHDVPNCPEFRGMSRDDRVAMVSVHRLCTICLSDEHGPASCNTKRRCQLCHRAHHTLLHHATQVPRSSPPRSPPKRRNGRNHQSGSGDHPSSAFEDDVLSICTSEVDFAMEKSWAEQMEEDDREKERREQKRPSPAGNPPSTQRFRPRLRHERPDVRRSDECDEPPRLSGGRNRNYRRQNRTSATIERRLRRIRQRRRLRQLNQTDLRQRISPVTTPLTLQPILAIIPTIALYIIRRQQRILVRALLNAGEMGTAICPSVVAQFQGPHNQQRGPCILTLQGACGRQQITVCAAVTNLKIPVAPAITMDPRTIEPFRHLQLADPYCWQSLPVHMVLGVDAYAKLIHGDRQQVVHNQLSAQSTIFGWTISGVSGV